MTRTQRWGWCCAAGLLLASPAWGADAEPGFGKGTKIITVNMGGGANLGIPERDHHTAVSFVNGGVRFGYLPFAPLGAGFLKGSVEVGLEPFAQFYFKPAHVSQQGLKAAARYHFLSTAPIVPYAEFAAGVMHSNLKIREIRSDYAFSLEGGLGFSYLLSPKLALTASYRFQHISNAGAETPNIGINSITGLLGVSFLFR